MWSRGGLASEESKQLDSSAQSGGSEEGGRSTAVGKPGHRSCTRRQARRHHWGHLSASSRVMTLDLVFWGTGPLDSEGGVDMGKAQL